MWITVGTKPNGKPARRHVKRKTPEEAEDAAEELLNQVRAQGRAPRGGRKPTVRSWSETYLETIAPDTCNPTTVDSYRSLLRIWV